MVPDQVLVRCKAERDQIQMDGVRVKERPAAKVVRFRPAADAIVFVGAAVVAGLAWSVRDAHYLTAEEGLGYAFGIAGVTCMVLMQVYSVRKRTNWLPRAISLRQCFRAHMFLGVIGPVLILMHCDFRMGSINSQVAFWSMAVMMSSGIAGRFIYSRIHRGLYGERVRLEELASALAQERESAPGAQRTQLAALELPSVSLPGQLLTHVRIIAAQRRNAGSGDGRASTYFRQLRVLSGLRIAERAFSLWHVVHLPLVGILALSVIAHVVVVHAY